MMGTIQWTFGVLVHANTNSPTGRSTAPRQQSGNLASGGALPPGPAARTALLYHMLPSGWRALPMSRPTPIPRKARPEVPFDQPRFCWKTMGKAVKKR